MTTLQIFPLFYEMTKHSWERQLGEERNPHPASMLPKTNSWWQTGIFKALNKMLTLRIGPERKYLHACVYNNNHIWVGRPFCHKSMQCSCIWQRVIEKVNHHFFFLQSFLLTSGIQNFPSRCVATQSYRAQSTLVFNP